MKTQEKIIEKNWFTEEIKNEKIKEYLNYILSYKRQNLSKYSKKKGKARKSSWMHLLPAVIFFGLSLVFPLLSGIGAINKNSDYTSTYYALGYISLIISTLILLADRLFIHSKSWIRYTITLNAIELISSKYYSQWIIILPKINDEAKAKSAIELLHAFDNELKSVIQNETNNWKDLFIGQLDEFNTQVSNKFKAKNSNKAKTKK